MAEDGNVFISEISKIEVIRSNQKVAKLDVPYGPAGIAAAGKLAAVGGEVCICTSHCAKHISRFLCDW